ncbi:MAG: hypothetical protein ABIP20_05645 [Chthoniobacteraceae bacterium]
MKTTALWLVIFLVALAAIPTAHAQKAARIGYVYPAGGWQGTTFDVTVGGQGLTGTNEVHFSGRGIQATVISHERPLTPKETELMREKIAQLEEERKSSASVSSKEKSGGMSDELAALKDKIAFFGNGRPFNVAIAENVTLRVTMASDATLGDQEIRIGTPGALSNPLLFQVGQLPEFSHPPARGSLKAEINARPRRYGKREIKDDGKEQSEAIALPVVLNGQILAGQVDHFRFKAKRGQRVVAAASARKLIPYLPDAVPGWFQAIIAIRDSKGRELAYADEFRSNPDPVLTYEIPKDGEYVIEIRDSIYRGREDFVYRITVGELPFISGTFPLGGSVGTQCTVLLRGWNLPVAAISLDLQTAKPGVLPLVVARGQTVSNFVPFAVDTLKEVLESEPNNSTADTQKITLPVVVNGRIDQPGDIDVFRFEGHAGDEIVAEIFARRLASALDSTLTLTDSSGKQLAFNDDNEDRGAGLTTHHADSRLAAKLPADGAYFLQVADAQHAGGPEHSYRLRVSAPRPDFELRVVPSSISGRAGASVPLTVHALRRDGFAGPITIALKDAPDGFKLGGATVPGDKDQAKLMLTLPQELEEPAKLDLEGHATIAGEEVTHRAVPAEDMQQAFAYHHLVPAKELLVAVVGHLSRSGHVKIATELPVKIPIGGSARVKITAAIDEKSGALQLELTDPPAGIAVKSVATSPEGAEIELQSEAGKVIAGEKGSLIVQAFAMRTGANGKVRRVPLGALPVIQFEIVATDSGASVR